MPADHPVPREDMEFLALLVHRGWVPRADAEDLLASAQSAGLDAALAAREEWDAKRVQWLRRTEGMRNADLPGYQVERLLGTGATAEVWAARRSKDLKRVALKILDPALARDPLAVRRFVAEAKMLQQLDAPNIARGYRAFRFLGTYVMELELVAGSTLEELLEQGEAFGEDEALAVVLQVAHALEALRAQGVVHRDLKPDNIMLAGDGTVKLIDLGFAAGSADADAGQADGTTLGTPAYLAPEQARGAGGLDARADIYSLGVTLFQLVVGRLPFESDDDQEMVRKQVLESLKGSALKDRGFSPALHYFIEKMMAKDRNVRYANAAELASDVEARLLR
jgi:serine/threonine protein kinase